MVNATTSGKIDQHHNRLGLRELVHEGVDFIFLKVEPHVAQVNSFNVLHENVRRKGIRVDLCNGEPFRTKKVHSSNFAGVSVCLGNEDGIRDSSDELEAIP